MSTTSLDTCGSSAPAVTLPRRRFIITLAHLVGLPPFYWHDIDVYYRGAANRLVYLSLRDIEKLSARMHPTLLDRAINRQAWNTLEVVIPAIEASTPFDDETDIHRAYHLAVMVAGKSPSLTVPLPTHLQVVASYMGSTLAGSLELVKKPDYLLQCMHMEDTPVKKEFSSNSNCVARITYTATKVDVSIEAKLNMRRGRVDVSTNII